MQFRIAVVGVDQDYSRMHDVVRVCHYLDVELSQRDYGPGVARLNMYIIIGSRTETGRAGTRKYSKANRLLEVSFSLNGAEVWSPSDSEQLAGILKRGILATYAAVKDLGIKDFDTDAFYRDSASLIDHSRWATSPEKYEKPLNVFRQPFLHPSTRETGQMEFVMAPPRFGSPNPALVHQLAPIANYLIIELSARHYGSGVVRLEMLVWCSAPGSESADLESHVNSISKTYYKTVGALIWDIKLNEAEVVSSDSGQFVEILRRAIMKTHAAVKALSIDDFDVDAFYRDIGALLERRDWTIDPDKYSIYMERQTRPLAASAQVQRAPFDGRAKRTARAPSSRVKLPAAVFWDLIRESIEVAGGSIERQLAHLESSLAARTENEIVGFELTLRNLIRQSRHHDVAALLKAIDGTVTDDGLLYFRCRLILYGQDLFYAAMKDPNKLKGRLDSDEAAEHLLSVADNAFLLKLGENTDKDLPRDIGATYIDYDLETDPLLGTPWTERSFAKRYAALLKLYK